MLIKKYPEIKKFDTVVVFGETYFVESCTNKLFMNCEFCDYRNFCQYIVFLEKTDKATKAGLESAEKNERIK